MRRAIHVLVWAAVLWVGPASAQTSPACNLIPQAACASAADDITGPWNFLGAAPLSFEGATADANETFVSVVDPTADRTLYIANADSGTAQAITCAADQYVITFTPSTGVYTCGALPSSTTFAGSCIGDASGDWCGTIDFSLGSPTVIAPSIKGSQSASGTLSLQSTTSGTRGTVDVVDQARVETTAPTITATHTVLELLPSGLTVNSNVSFRGIFLGSTITYEANPSAISSGSLFNAAPILVNPDTEARTMSQFTVLGNNVTVTPNASDNMTALSIAGLNNNPTLTGSAGAHTATAMYAVRAAGVTDANWTVTDWATARMLAPTDGAVSGTAAITRLGFAEIDDLTQGTTNYSIWSKGPTAFMAHEGNAWFGGDQASLSADPGMPVRATQQTVGNEVVRFESVATNDDPNYKMFQARATAAASSTTNVDFSLTASVPTAPCPASSVCIVEARTVCHCTSGSSCTAHDGGANISAMTVKNNGGTISLLGAVTTPMASQIGASSLTSLTLSVSSPNARMAVVVPANFAHTCHLTFIVSAVGT